jgi:hypothetical protein
MRVPASAVDLITLDSEVELSRAIANLSATIRQARTLINALDDSVKAVTDMNGRFQAFVHQFIKVDEKGSSCESYWLEIKPIVGGGNN